MGKRKRPPRVELLKSASTSTPFNNPFGALAGVREALPGQQLDEQRPQPIPATPRKATLADCGKLVIQRERKGRAGKTVTRVGGLPVELLQDFAPRLKSALGCGATVESGELILLGDLVDRVAGWLESEGARLVVISGRPSGGAKGSWSVTPSWRQGSRRSDLELGLTVDIVLKGDQDTGKRTRGVIQDILTSSATHPRGIKVRLGDGSVGRVVGVFER